MVSFDVPIRAGRFPIQALLDAWPGLGTQPHYEAVGDLRVEIVQTQWLVRLSLREWPKVGRGAAKQQSKKEFESDTAALVLVVMDMKKQL